MKLLAEGFDNVVPEFVDVLISRGQYRGVAAAKVERARPRNGYFRHQLRMRFQKLEVANIDRFGPTHAAVDDRDRLCCALARDASLRVFAIDRVDADVAELPV